MPNKSISAQLEEYYDWCENVKGMLPATMVAKKNAINYFVEFSEIEKLEDITNKQINGWMAEQTARGVQGRSINCRLAQLVVMLKWQRDEGVIMPDLKLNKIVKRKERPPRKVWFDREQINSALACADRREWLLIKLSFDCGLRISELQHIRLEDISDTKIEIIGKGMKKRFVFMSEDARQRLDDWIMRERIDDYLWPSKSNPKKPLSDSELREMMRKPFEAVGLNNFYPHSLRHSFATDLQKHGAKTGEIKIALGHSNEVTTERYMHELDGSDAEEIWAAYKFAAPEPCLR